MKCMYNQSKRGLPSDVRTMALKVAIAKEISAEYCNKYNKCQECRKDYWLAEVDT